MICTEIPTTTPAKMALHLIPGSMSLFASSGEIGCRSTTELSSIFTAVIFFLLIHVLRQATFGYCLHRPEKITGASLQSKAPRHHAE